MFLTQLAMKWLSNVPPHPLFVSALRVETKSMKYCILSYFAYLGFPQILQKQTFDEVETRTIF